MHPSSLRGRNCDWSRSRRRRKEAPTLLLLHTLLPLFLVALVVLSHSNKSTFTVVAMSSPAASSFAAKKGALIFLHGLGDTPAGWSQLQQILPEMKPRLKDIAYVFPPAPTIPITINGGMKMPGWFDLYDWPIAVGSQDDKEGLMAGIKTIENEVSKLNEQGIPSEKIVLGGFSQGGAVALLAAYRSQHRYAGCAGLSAWLTLPQELSPIPYPAKFTPLFWGHGRMDDKVLFAQQKFGIDRLKGAGVISVKDEAYDMGHSSHPDEMQTLADFVDESIFEETVDYPEEL